MPGNVDQTARTEAEKELHLKSILDPDGGSEFINFILIHLLEEASGLPQLTIGVKL